MFPRHFLSIIRPECIARFNSLKWFRNYIILYEITYIFQSLNGYIDTLVEAEEENEDYEENAPGELIICNEIEWKPEMDALLRYGGWLTSTRKLLIDSIGGVPENFLEKSLLHLANSRYHLKVYNNIIWI